MNDSKRPKKICGKNRHLYYTGINDGVQDEGYIGKDFHPGTWIFTNYLWNSGMAHKSKIANQAYKHTPKLSTHWLGCLAVCLACLVVPLIIWVVANGQF